MKLVICAQQEPHCIQCKIRWTSDFLHMAFPKSWLTSAEPDGYLEARKRVALDIEKAKIPYTFEILIPRRKRLLARKTAALEIRKRGAEYLRLHWHWMAVYYNLRHKQSLREAAQGRGAAEGEELAESGVAAAREKAEAARHAVNKINKLLVGLGGSRNEKNSILTKLLCRCPIDGCRGIVGYETQQIQDVGSIPDLLRRRVVPGTVSEGENALSDLHRNVTYAENEKDNDKMGEQNTAMCPTCSIKLCIECFAVLGETTHACDPDTVASVAAIKAESKPCPGCGVRISKVGGCDQMWCTQCRTAFSWDSLKKDNGVVHNPHAVQWQATLRADQQPCGVQIRGFPHITPRYAHVRILNRAFRRFAEMKGLRGVEELDADSFIYLIMSIDEIIEKVDENADTKLDELRILYCLGKVTEEEWKEDIFRIMRKNDRKIVVRRVLDGLREVIIQRMHVLLNSTREEGGSSERKAEDAIFEVFQLLELSVESLQAELLLLGLKPIRFWDITVEEGVAFFKLTKHSIVEGNMSPWRVYAGDYGEQRSKIISMDDDFDILRDDAGVLENEFEDIDDIY